MNLLTNLETKERVDIQIWKKVQKLPGELMNLLFYPKLKSTEQAVRSDWPGLEFS